MTTTELALIEDSPITRTLAIADRAWPMIERICKASTLSPAYRGKPEEALAAVLMGAPLGLDLMQCLQEIHVIQGTPALSAKAQRGVVQMAGHTMWLEESSSAKVVMAGHRKGDDIHVQRSTWSIDRAQKLGLVNKDNWKKQPETMLIARATGELSRLLASDALLGLAYNAEEVGDGASDDEGWDDVPTDPPDGLPAGANKPPSNRRSAKGGSQRKAAQQPAAPPPAAAAEPPLPPLPGEDDPPAPAATGSSPASDRPVEDRRSDAVRIKTEEVLGQLDRDERLVFWSACLGREATSGKDLTSTDAEAIFATLELIETGQASWEAGELVFTPDAEGNPVGEEASWSAEGWKEWREGLSKTHVELIRGCKAVGEAMGVDPPSSVRSIVKASPAFKAALRVALEGGKG